MSEGADTLHNSKIRNFEQKVINQSLLDIRCFDRLADYLLECCHAQAKPNTLSLFSCLPLLILALVQPSPTRLSFALAIIAILTHQLLDIANKKQAFRLSQFSLATFYLDHVLDAISCLSLVYLMGSLMSMPASTTLTAMFFLGALPFYTHHLAMYNNDYMTFPKVSPATEGLVLTNLFLFFSILDPTFFQYELFQNYSVAHLYIAIASMWLLVVLAFDLKAILMGKRVTDAKAGTEENFPLKNLFVILMVGYLVLEVTSIQAELLGDGLYVSLFFCLFSLLLAYITGNLVLAYGYNISYKQVTIPLLIVSGIVVFFYAGAVFFLRQVEAEAVVAKIVMAVTLALFGLWFIRDSAVNIRHIKQVLSNDQ